VYKRQDLTHTRADLYRAVLEGIAMGTAHVFETCAEVGASPVTVRAVGGGTKNALWLQATSDLSGVPQELCDKTIGASYGDAFLAALAVGLVGEGDIAHWNPVSARVTPERVAAYDRQYPLWKRLYAQTRDIAHGLAVGQG
jgi:xylulokinase